MTEEHTTSLINFHRHIIFFANEGEYISTINVKDAFYGNHDGSY